MHVDWFFNHYSNFLSAYKQTQFNKSRGVTISWNTKIWHIINMVAESFRDWSQLNNISRLLEITFLYFSILRLLMNFRDFQVFVFRYRSPNENPEITENFYFWFYKAQINVDLFYDYYFNFLSVQTDITKRASN